MTDEPLLLSDILDDPSLQRVLVDPDEVSKFTSEDDYMSLAVELFKEIGIITLLVAGLYRHDETGSPTAWTRNDAIIGGLFIRLSKMQRGMLDAVCQQRAEIAHLLSRCLFETVINLRYLLIESSDALYDAYVEYSLREEKRLLKLIERKVDSRGHELPIEGRMKASIMKAFRNSGVLPDSVDEKKRAAWGGSVYKRAERVGFSEGYIALMALPSHVIHGNWQDLLMYHLDRSGNAFEPRPEWTMPRPQMVFAAAFLSAEICKLYLAECFEGTDGLDAVLERIDDFASRVKLADELHEKHLHPD